MKFKFNLDFLKKYNVDYNKIIGFEKKEDFNNKIKDSDNILDLYNFYALYVKQKVIRRERNITIYPKYLVSTYIDLSLLSVYSVDIEESLFNTIGNIEDYIETKLYQEFGTNNKFIFKYNILKYKNQSKYHINVIFIKYDYIEKHYLELLKKIGYIDYITIPFLSYKFLYKEDIISSSNIDIFIVIQWDKTFITIYNNKKFITNIINYDFNLNSIYTKLKEEFEIEDFDEKTFYKLLNKKGLDPKKYSKYEIELRDFLQYQLELNFKTFLLPEIEKVLTEFKLSNKLNNIFITTDKVNINNINAIEENVKISLLDIKDINVNNLKIQSFNFLDTYNLDKLPISPFLFLSMLECYYSFKENDFSNNISIWKRKPNFLYRPLGKLLISIVAATLLFLSGKLYFNIKIKQYNNEIKKLNKKVKTLTNKNIKLKIQLKNNLDILNRDYKILKENMNMLNYNISLINEIDRFNNYYKVILNIYKIIDYIYKSNVKLLNYKLDKGNELELNIISNKKENIINFLKLIKGNKKLKILNNVINVKQINIKNKKYWDIIINIKINN